MDNRARLRQQKEKKKNSNNKQRLQNYGATVTYGQTVVNVTYCAVKRFRCMVFLHKREQITIISSSMPVYARPSTSLAPINH